MAAPPNGLQQVSEDVQPSILTLRNCLVSEENPLAERFRALFSLKHIASQACDVAGALGAVEAIADGFGSPSVLLKHELAYCLGQTAQASAAPHLRRVLENIDEDPMVRHESAEALGALGYRGDLEILRRYRDRDGEEDVVRETCEIAVDRIEWQHSEKPREENLPRGRFSSVDPAPPMPLHTDSVEELAKLLSDATLPLFRRYRAMFALRELASPPGRPTAVAAVEALAAGLRDRSALFRHEVAFVFGQLAHPASIPALAATLGDSQEASMVRHEAAEALGSLGAEDGVEEILRKFLDDKEPVVRDSILVALDMAEYEKSPDIEYALVPNTTAASA